MLYILTMIVFASIFYAAYQLSINVGRSEVYVAKTSESLNRGDVKNLSFTKSGQGRKEGIVGIVKDITYRFTPVRLVKFTEELIVQAGLSHKYSLDSVMAVKMIISGLVMLVFTLAAITAMAPLTFIKGLMAGVVFFMLPDIYLGMKISQRKQAIRKQFPDFLDLLAVSVQAGIGFDIALKKLTGSFEGPLVDEFKRMLKEIQLGISRKDAFKNLSDRVRITEIQGFVQSMLMADSFGVSIAKVLKQKASEMRTKRRQRAEEIAMKAPVKILFPLIFFIFPVLLIVILGPAMIRIYSTLF